MKTKMVVMSLLVAFAFSFTGVMSASEPAVKPVFQDSFENVGADGLPVGWTIFGTATQQKSADVVRTGALSWFLDDQSNAGTVGLRSPMVPVVVGRDYTASAWAFVKKGGVQVYLEFWDEAGKRLSATSTSGGTVDQWVQIQNTKTAPEGAKTATLIVYTHKTNVGSAYFDDAEILPAN